MPAPALRCCLRCCLTLTRPPPCTLLPRAQEIVRHRGEDLVKSYCRRFDAFVSASKYIRRITEYMHRFWIPQQINDTEDVDVKELNILVLCRWDDLVLQRIELLLPVLLDLINQSRQGDEVDWKVLAGVIRSFVTIGSADAEQPVQLYTEMFETKFLRRTQQFYKKASSKFITEVRALDLSASIVARLSPSLTRPRASSLRTRCRTTCAKSHSGWQRRKSARIDICTRGQNRSCRTRALGC